jgi:hypothetical protein
MVRAKKTRKVVGVKNPWFRKREGARDGWGFIPINWKGGVALILLVGLNVFAAVYFDLNSIVLDSYLRMGVVFLLSVFVFIEIAKRRTRG